MSSVDDLRARASVLRDNAQKLRNLAPYAERAGDRRRDLEEADRLLSEAVRLEGEANCLEAKA